MITNARLLTIFAINFKDDVNYELFTFQFN